MSYIYAWSTSKSTGTRHYQLDRKLVTHTFRIMIQTFFQTGWYENMAWHNQIVALHLRRSISWLSKISDESQRNWNFASNIPKITSIWTAHSLISANIFSTDLSDNRLKCSFDNIFNSVVHFGKDTRIAPKQLLNHAELEYICFAE